MACKILEKGLPKTSNSGECLREPEYINAVGQVHSIDEESWKQAKEYSQQLDNLTKNFGTKPTTKEIKEMPKFKGLTYQRRENLGTAKNNQYKVITPPDSKEIGLDLGAWLQNAKVSMPVT